MRIIGWGHILQAKVVDETNTKCIKYCFTNNPSPHEYTMGPSTQV